MSRFLFNNGIQNLAHLFIGFRSKYTQLKKPQNFFCGFPFSFLVLARHRGLRTVGTFKHGIIHLQSEICAENRAEFISELLLFRFFLRRESDTLFFSCELVDTVCSCAHNYLHHSSFYNFHTMKFNIFTKIAICSHLYA